MAGPVVTLGVFDGVHLGHRALIRQARDVADRRGAALTVLTFDPHPLSIVRPGSEPAMLATVNRRARLLEEAGADTVVVLHFDEAMARETPEEFVDSVLVGQLGTSAVMVGENFTFGHLAAGTVDTLTRLGADRGFEVLAFDLVQDMGAVVSSTRIRELIAEGDVGGTCVLLGRAHRVQGEVVHGEHRGRELGFPTANLGGTAGLAIPADGVYAARLVLAPDGDESPSWAAAVSVGTNPTFGEHSRRVEAYAIDAGHELNLYGRVVAVDFIERLRGMEAFDSVEVLVSQMKADVEQSREVTRSR